MLAIAMALGALGKTPLDDSNYSVQSGKFTHLKSFVSVYPELPYGMVEGRANLHRMARSGVTMGSIGVWFETLPPSLEGTTVVMTSTLHARTCEEDAGAVFQDPFNCPSDGGFTEGCSQNEVDNWGGAEPLEMHISSTLETTSGAAGAQIHRVSERTHVRALINLT
jgi:hypothetical protein